MTNLDYISELKKMNLLENKPVDLANVKKESTDELAVEYFEMTDNDGKVDYISYSECDEDGRITRHLTDYNGDKDGNRLSDYEEINVFENGKLKYCVKKDRYSSLTYNNIDAVVYDENERITATFDELNEDGVFFKAENFYYDEYGNQTKCILEANDGYKCETNFTYNDKQLLIKSESDFWADGVIDRTVDFEYDENNNLKKKNIDDDGDGKVDEITTYEYFENNIIKSEDTKYLFYVDKKIDDFKQGAMGDCWLLATLKSLSSTEEGAKFIKDSISENKDGSYNVEFKGIDKTYTIENDEFTDFQYANFHSSGDDDVFLFEIAFEKALEDLKKDNINDSYLKAYKKDLSDGEDNLDGWYCEPALYMLTGKKASIIDNLNDLLKETDGDLNHKLVVASVSKGDFQGDSYVTIKDINGQDAIVTANTEDGYHALSILSMEDENVVFVNPWDISKEYTVNKDELDKYVSYITYYDFEPKSFIESVIDFWF